LFAWGLAPYAPKDEKLVEFITRTMTTVVLPRVEKAAKPGMLVVLGSYPHQTRGEAGAYNRAATLIGGHWCFSDKLDPTQGEMKENPPIRPGRALPVFYFRGGSAQGGQHAR